MGADGCRRRAGGLLDFWTWILRAGYDGGPAVGPGGLGFHGPLGLLPCSAGRAGAGQVGCGMAWIRCQAVTISSAQGQVAAIFRHLRRPPRTRRAAPCRTRYVSHASRVQAIMDASSHAWLIV